VEDEKKTCGAFVNSFNQLLTTDQRKHSRTLVLSRASMRKKKEKEQQKDTFLSHCVSSFFNSSGLVIAMGHRRSVPKPHSDLLSQRRGAAQQRKRKRRYQAVR
jgi:hypothetical protein